MVSLAFVAGTLELRGFAEGDSVPEACRWDARSHCYRAPALSYAEVMRAVAV
jgi:hypothetical protein